MTVSRVGAVDIGTNTTRLLVAEVAGDALVEIERRTAITRLGEGVDRSASLLPAAMKRVLERVAEYEEICNQHGAERRLAIATSAVRDALNGHHFLAQVSELGFDARLLAGEEEALLAFRGATLGRKLSEPLLVVDIGGGSTELVLGDGGGPSFHVSLDVGAVRLTERFLHSDPPTPEEVEAAAADVRRLLDERVPMTARVEPAAALGNAGTVTTLAALDQQLPAYDRALVHGYSLTRAAVADQLERLAALPLAERRQVPALEPERAPVILGGVVILRELLAAFDLEAIEASERDILDGAALLAADELRA